MAGVDKTILQLGSDLMELTAQVTRLSQVKEASRSACQRIRFGSEFCMYNLPTIEEIKTAHKITTDAVKEFVYVTPRLADSAMDKVRQQLILLNNLGSNTVVANDLGTLRIIRRLPNLKPHLGRQLVYTPSRCPWKQITEQSVNILAKKKLEQIFYQTNLNYEPTINFFKDMGVVGVDVDWIPQLFKNLSLLQQNQLKVSVHLQTIPVAITRKCHTARFHGEGDLEHCSKRCGKDAYSMENDILKTSLLLHGNVVFRNMEPKRTDVRELAQSGVTELVITMSPITTILSKAQLDDLIQHIQEL